jgi:topoisomerase-4 subunit A
MLQKYNPVNENLIYCVNGKLLKRDVTYDDILKLTEIRIKRISKFDKFKADEQIKGLEQKIEAGEKNLETR